MHKQHLPDCVFARRSVSPHPQTGGRPGSPLCLPMFRLSVCRRVCPVLCGVAGVVLAPPLRRRLTPLGPARRYTHPQPAHLAPPPPPPPTSADIRRHPPQWVSGPAAAETASPSSCRALLVPYTASGRSCRTGASPSLDSSIPRYSSPPVARNIAACRSPRDRRESLPPTATRDVPRPRRRVVLVW